MIKFPDFSGHFKRLLTGHRIDPRNSSNKKRNAHVIYDIFMTTMFYVTTCV